MNKWIFILLSAALLGAGSLWQLWRSATATPETAFGPIFSTKELDGLNRARVKVTEDQMGYWGFCRSARIQVGTYEDADDIKRAALNILRTRNSRIRIEHLEAENAPYVNFTTDPPTSSRGEITRTLLRPDGSVESLNVESSQTTIVSIKLDFYNTYYQSLEDRPDCKGYSPIDNSCIGSLEFTEGLVLMGVLYPC